MDRIPEANRMPFKTTAEMIFEEGRDSNRIELVQGLLSKGYDWAFIQDITQIDRASFDLLLKKYQT